MASALATSAANRRRGFCLAQFSLGGRTAFGTDLVVDPLLFEACGRVVAGKSRSC